MIFITPTSYVGTGLFDAAGDGIGIGASEEDDNSPTSGAVGVSCTSQSCDLFI